MEARRGVQEGRNHFITCNGGNEVRRRRRRNVDAIGVQAWDAILHVQLQLQTEAILAACSVAARAVVTRSVFVRGGHVVVASQSIRATQDFIDHNGLVRKCRITTSVRSRERAG